MSLNFPATPSPGETFTAEGRTFEWTGAVWILQAEMIPWATMAEALAGVSADTIMSPATMRAAIEASEPPPPDFGPMTCRAWALITGSTGAVLASRNIASVVMNPEGQYAVTFQTPLPNANYVVHGNNRFNGEKLMSIGLRIGVNPTPQGFSITSSTTGGSGVVGVPRGTGRISLGVFL